MLSDFVVSWAHSRRIVGQTGMVRSSHSGRNVGAKELKWRTLHYTTFDGDYDSFPQLSVRSVKGYKLVVGESAA